MVRQDGAGNGGTIMPAEGDTRVGGERPETIIAEAGLIQGRRRQFEIAVKVQVVEPDTGEVEAFHQLPERRELRLAHGGLGGTGA